MPVSAVDCVQPALQHTRTQLFTNFRWGQWSRLALVGILAAELHVGGCSIPNLGGGWPNTSPKNQNEIMQSSLPHGFPSFNPARIPEHIGQFLGLIVLGIVVFFVLAFVFLYINSVFRFILFDSVLQRQCSIGEGWQKWHRAGRRYFLWQIVFQIAVWLFLLVLIGVPLLVALTAGWTSDIRQHLGRMIVGIVLLVGLVVVAVLITAIVQALAKDFLVPIMALENLDFADGWHRLLAMIRPEKGRFAVYLLLKLVLAIAAGILFTIIAVIPALFVFVPVVVAIAAGHAAGLGWTVTTISLTIVLASVLLFVLIYLVALVSVPATVFFPAYALHFLAARYPNLNVLLNPTPIVPAPELPPVPQSTPEAPPSFEPPLPLSPEPAG